MTRGNTNSLWSASLPYRRWRSARSPSYRWPAGPSAVPVSRRSPNGCGRSATRSGSSSSSTTASTRRSSTSTSPPCRSFFALPDSIKARIDKAQSPWFRGWERVGAELTDLSVDYREQIDVWTELPPRPRDVEPAVPPPRRPEPVARRRDAAGLPPCRRTLPARDGRHRRPAHGRDVRRPRSPARPPRQALRRAALVAGEADPLSPDAAWRSRRQRPSRRRLPHAAVAARCGRAAGPERGRRVDRRARLRRRDRRQPGRDPPVDDRQLLRRHDPPGHRRPRSATRRATSTGPDLRTVLDPLPLDHRFADAVAASPRHRDAGLHGQARRAPRRRARHRDRRVPPATASSSGTTSPAATRTSCGGTTPTSHAVPGMEPRTVLRGSKRCDGSWPVHRISSGGLGRRGGVWGRWLLGDSLDGDDGVLDGTDGELDSDDGGAGPRRGPW